MVLQREGEGRKEEGPRCEEGRELKAKCFFCDTELEVVLHTFKVGPREEPVCEECHVKTANRLKAKAEEGRGPSG
jgi:hypothetical protein